MTNTTLLLSVADVSRYLHIGRNKTYILMKKPGFPYVKVGSRYFVTKDALDEYIAINQGKAII